MALRLFKKNLYGVAHTLRFGRYGSIIRSIHGELPAGHATKIADVNSNDLEVVADDGVTLKNLKVAASSGYTALSAGATKERNKKRVTNREEIETDFVRKSSRNLKQLTLNVTFATTNGIVSVTNFTNLDIIQAYPIPQNYVVDSISIVCTATYNGTTPTSTITLVDDSTTHSLIILSPDDLTIGEKFSTEVYIPVSSVAGLTLNVAQSIGGSTAGSLTIYLTYYGKE